ncbi:protein CASC4-like isoform X1 [Zootermopsis nevadensis]|uniref:Protein casc4 n=1 Tax=Zootermopsis nevadensis TaxID=136037 RepID=A0A067R3Q1_ZOONE|nr:protein CASC4-like isoform X1 [Zootermopsis nevadensis]KDR13779.1 hypothetical protein L798_12073 [Zootermopsis nevadensis]
MSLDNMRGSYGRCPPFLVAGLLVVCIILTFNWWSLSSQNYDLIRQIEELGEQLKISSEEQDLCVHQRLSVEGRVKVLEDEMAQVRVNFEQQRTDNDEMKKTLDTKDNELKDMKKQQDNDHKSANLCKTELESLKKLEISKDGTITSLRLEKTQLTSQLDEIKQELQQMQGKLKEVQAALKTASKNKQPSTPKRLPTDQPLKPADTGVAEGGDHERGGGQEQEKAENEENNAGERGDEMNPEEGAGDNGPEGAVGEEPVAMQVGDNRL